MAIDRQCRGISTLQWARLSLEREQSFPAAREVHARVDPKLLLGPEIAQREIDVVVHRPGRFFSLIGYSNLPVLDLQFIESKLARTTAARRATCFVGAPDRREVPDACGI